MTSIGCVMPTLNQSRYIVAALDSIAGQVDELVIVLDGCTDDTLRKVVAWPTPEGLRVKILPRTSNRGTAATINEGIAALDGEHDWWTWVSSDNTYSPAWRECILKADAPDVGAVYSAFRYCRPGGSGAYHFTAHSPETLLQQEACYYGPSFLIRPSVWQPHRGRISHDFDSWLRVEEACWAQGKRIVGVPHALCDYLAHSERVTVTRRHEYDAPHWQAEARKRRAT